MYLGERELEESIVFYANTIDTAGSRADAAGNPSYLVYEEENGVAITGGSLTLLGGAGSGLYSEALTLAAVTGFQLDRWYVIYIWASVDGETPAAIHTFKIVERPVVPTVEQIWKRIQPANPDPNAMEDIKTDTDNLEFVGKEG